MGTLSSMNNRIHLMAAAAALLVLQPFAVNAVLAADSSPAVADKTAKDSKSDKAKEKKICSFETPTGSIRRVRICRTQAQVDADAQRSQSQIDDLQRLSQQPTQALHS